MKPIDIWFHCWCGNSNLPVSNSRLLKFINNKIDKLKKSGLYDSTTNIYLVASQISNKNKFIFEEVKNLYKKIILIELPKPEIGNECDTLNIMISHYKNSEINSNILYFHTKSFKYPENAPITDRMIKWVRYMDLHLIRNWEYAQDILKYYDTHGIFIFKPGEDSRKPDEPDNRKTYAGHYWWSKSEYIRTLDLIDKNYQKSRGEFHLLDKADVKYHVTPTNYPWLYEKDFHKDEMDDEFYFPKGW